MDRTARPRWAGKRVEGWFSPPLALSALLGAIVLTGCGEDSTGPGDDVEIFIENPVQGNLLTGEEAQLIANRSDPSVTGSVVWFSSDTAVARVDHTGHVWAHRPGTTTITAELRRATDDVQLAVVQRPGGYTAEEIDYFQDIAFGFEYGSASRVVRKWGENPRLMVFGTPTAQDLIVLDDVVADLNALMEEAQVEVVESDPTVEVHFAPVAQFPSILPGYVQGNLGYFSVWFGGDNRINQSVVLLASDDVDQEGRSHLLREEVTQMLGLARDSYRYPNSIFYQSWTTTQEYASIDEALIEILYRPALSTGLGYRDATDLLRTLIRRGAAEASAESEVRLPTRMRDRPAKPDETTRAGRGGTGSGSGGERAGRRGGGSTDGAGRG